MFEELGPGDVLTRLVYTTKTQTPPATLDQIIQEHRSGDVPATAAPTRLGAAQEKVIAWNKRHPIGTRLKSSIMDGDELEAETEAVVLFGHRAAVYMKGYKGYFDLDELTPV